MSTGGASRSSCASWATTDSDPSGQIEGKLITGWLQKLGIRIDFSVLDPGALNARLWNFRGSTYTPDFDLYVNSWLGYLQPRRDIDGRDHGEDRRHERTERVDSQYDRLCAQQAAALDTTARQALIRRMQEIMYQQTPWIVLTYPDFLRGLRHGQMDGLDTGRRRQGAGLLYAGNVDSYVNLRPVAARATRGAASTAWIVGAAVIVAIVVACVFALRRRSRPRAVEE